MNCKIKRRRTWKLSFKDKAQSALGGALMAALMLGFLICLGEL